MTSCKRCGKPANLYSKWSLCDDCGTIKSKWEIRYLIARIFTIVIGIQLSIPFLYAIAKISSPLTSFIYVIYMSIWFVVGLALVAYSYFKVNP